MTKKVIQHTTKEGQRWDTIALENYGSAVLMNKLIEANPGIPRSDVLPAGIILDIPIIEQVDVLTNAELLPPWKRP